MEVTLLSITNNSEVLIEKCTRICYNSESKITPDSHKKFLPNIIKRGHVSPLSFAHAVFHISGISRACSHQLVRQSHLRYLQRSQRYCMENKAEYITPDNIEKNGQFLYHEFMKEAKDVYQELRDQGVKREDARFVLPNAISTEMCIAGNLQAWWDFLRLRLGKHAQWEIRKIAKEIYRILNVACPNIFTKELLEYQPKINLDIE